MHRGKTFPSSRIILLLDSWLDYLVATTTFCFIYCSSAKSFVVSWVLPVIYTFFLWEFIKLHIWYCCFLSNSIFQKGIDENWEAALEHNPEAFGRVVCFTLSHSSCFTIFAEEKSILLLYVLCFVVLINEAVFVSYQVMLYVDMEVNGVPLKVLKLSHVFVPV